jgi:DNA-binding LytR/AlgR family response regulator
MNKISVSEKVDGGGLSLLDIDTVLFIEYDRGINRILFHTVDNVYYTIGNLVYWLGLLNANGFRFARADRNGIISLDKIKRMDRVLCRAYFEDDKSGKHCPFADSRFKAIQSRAANLCFI